MRNRVARCTLMSWPGMMDYCAKRNIVRPLRDAIVSHRFPKKNAKE